MGIPLKMAKFRWLELVVVLVISRWVDGLESSGKNVGNGNGVLMVDLTLVQGAASKGAVCLDGTLPGYHLHNGFGSGVNSWLIELEGGGWCTDIQSCVSRKNSALGSSNNMTSNAFTGLLSNKPEENPDFYNWNRVRVRYCDGASFAGEGYDEANKLYFRGQRIWSAVMEELLSKGLRNADQALLSGCSAGGLASILHCDQFKALFPNNNNSSSSSSSKIIKCLSDAGFFLDATDISGGHFIRDYYHGVVTLQEVAKNLPSSCTDHLDPTSCFFPQNVIAHVKTPLFILNAAYDSWQVKEILVPPKTDPHGLWHDCKQNISKCSPSQLHLLQGLRTLMISVVNTTSFAGSSQNGLFINSCYTHCQSEMQQTWFANNSPILEHKKVATAIGDWFFDRAPVKLLDCPYPCDNSCLNEVSI